MSYDNSVTTAPHEVKPLHEASASLTAIVDGETIAEQQKYIAQLRRQIVELTNANAALAKQVEIERSFVINTAAWFVSSASDLVVYPDDKPVLAFTLLEEERGAVFGGVVRRFVMDEGPLPHRLCTVCRDLDCGETIECNSRGSYEPLPAAVRSSIEKAHAIRKAVKGALPGKYTSALELLDECRASLSIEEEDAAAGQDFAARCQRMSALSQQVDTFLESVGYGDMPRLKDRTEVLS